MCRSKRESLDVDTRMSSPTNLEVPTRFLIGAEKVMLHTNETCLLCMFKRSSTYHSPKKSSSTDGGLLKKYHFVTILWFWGFWGSEKSFSFSRKIYISITSDITGKPAIFSKWLLWTPLPLQPDVPQASVGHRLTHCEEPGGSRFEIWPKCENPKKGTILKWIICTKPPIFRGYVWFHGSILLKHCRNPQIPGLFFLDPAIEVLMKWWSVGLRPPPLSLNKAGFFYIPCFWGR